MIELHNPEGYDLGNILRLPNSLLIPNFYVKIGMVKFYATLPSTTCLINRVVEYEGKLVGLRNVWGRGETITLYRVNDMRCKVFSSIESFYVFKEIR